MFPTQDAEALSNFVQGRALLQAYLGTGLGDRLQKARDRFEIAAARDPNFDVASLYLAATQTELRRPEAIPLLERLVAKKVFLPEALVQLAYAHIKSYTDEGYAAAATELDNARRAAEDENRLGLVQQVDAYRVFLLAVRGGRSHEDPTTRQRYLREAVAVGQRILAETARSPKETAGQVVPTGKAATVSDLTDESQKAARFEVLNALGIAYMRLGQQFPGDQESETDWQRAEKFYKEALTLRPYSVRVMQNVGLLGMLRGDRMPEGSSAAQRFYRDALASIESSMKLNPFDQYPHSQAALLHARLGEWDAATNEIIEGKRQPGAVSDLYWKNIDEAVKAKDSKRVRQLV